MVRKLYIHDTKGNLIPRTPSKVFSHAMYKLLSERNSPTFKQIIPEIIADLQEALIFGVYEAALELAYL
ncbi:MAG: hypothetical protein RCG15_08635 [Candidatus Rickettsia vulgarisii]